MTDSKRTGRPTTSTKTEEKSQQINCEKSSNKRHLQIFKIICDIWSKAPIKLRKLYEFYKNREKKKHVKLANFSCKFCTVKRMERVWNAAQSTLGYSGWVFLDYLSKGFYFGKVFRSVQTN